MKSIKKRLMAAMLVFYIQAYAQQDPAINQILSSVNGDSLVMIVKELSGEVQTTIKGATVRIRSRYAYEPGNNSAADYIEQKLTLYGYQSINQEDGATSRNVYAMLTGSTEPQNKYVICAHYDSQNEDGPKSIAPGADDNASGVAAALEAARILKAYSPKYTIVFAFFDEEEIDFIGSQYYVSQNGSHTLGAINIDMIGYDGNNDNKVDVHLRNIANSSVLSDAVKKVNELYGIGAKPYIRNPGTDESDHSAFWNEGYGAIMLEESENDFSEVYHTSDDLFSELNSNYFLKCAKLGIGTLAYLSLPPYSGGTSVYTAMKPINFRLDQNYPNPFNPATTINYSVSEQSYVTITVYDAIGKKVASLVNEEKSVGDYTMEFDASNLSTGIYFYQMKTNVFIQTNKMVLLK